MKYNEQNELLKLSEEFYEKTKLGVESKIKKYHQKQRRIISMTIILCLAFIISPAVINKISFKDTVVLESVTTEKETLVSNNIQEDIIIKIDHTKAISQKFLINGKIYSQYYSKNKDYVKIKKNSIGKSIGEIDTENIVENLEPFALVNEKRAKKNKFYKAKVYEYLDEKSMIIVQVENEYYLFDLVK